MFFSSQDEIKIQLQHLSIIKEKMILMNQEQLK